MVKRLSHRHVVLVIIFLTTNCAYYPHLTDVPLIRKKGDARFEGGVTLLAPTVHASVSYGLTEHIAIRKFPVRYGICRLFKYGSDFIWMLGKNNFERFVSAACFRYRQT
ncbi:MAG: hypothetical protein LBM08_05770 [Dysgonamonadaceae bacterium]|nr:hypothetical protein [Dysgonamonadaceae bacterium]